MSSDRQRTDESRRSTTRFSASLVAMPTQPYGCKWQQVVDFPLCGLKRVSVASARASCQFEKLLEEIKKNIYIIFIYSVSVCFITVNSTFAYRLFVIPPPSNTEATQLSGPRLSNSTVGALNRWEWTCGTGPLNIATLKIGRFNAPKGKEFVSQGSNFQGHMLVSGGGYCICFFLELCSECRLSCNFDDSST